MLEMWPIFRGHPKKGLGNRSLLVQNRYEPRHQSLQEVLG